MIKSFRTLWLLLLLLSGCSNYYLDGGDYIGNYKCPSRVQVLLKPDSTSFGAVKEYILIDNKSTGVDSIPTILSTYWDKYLIEIENNHEEGVLYDLDIPILGLSAHLCAEEGLEMEYRSVSDCIIIHNPLYSVYFIPIEMRSPYIHETINIHTFLPILLYRLRELFQPYRDLGKRFEIRSRRNLKGDYVAYANSNYPDIQLIYRVDGPCFTKEYAHILQYPIVVSGEFGQPRVLFSDAEQKLCLWPTSAIKDCLLMPYNSGYLLYSGNRSKKVILKQNELSNLIVMSNSFINNNLNIE